MIKKIITENLTFVPVYRQDDVIPENLSRYQDQRAVLGLPYDGPQPACMYVSFHDEGSIDSYNNQPAMAATIPTDSDLSKTGIEALLEKVRDDLGKKIPVRGAMQITNCLFLHGIDISGHSIHGHVKVNYDREGFTEAAGKTPITNQPSAPNPA